MVLEKLRNEIDSIDDEIVKLLRKRLNISYKIGKYKTKKNMKIYDRKREIEIYNKINEKAEKNNLDERFINKIFKIIIRDSRERQK